jgi:hypothetical protein
MTVDGIQLPLRIDLVALGLELAKDLTLVALLGRLVLDGVDEVLRQEAIRIRRLPNWGRSYFCNSPAGTTKATT